MEGVDCGYGNGVKTGFGRLSGWSLHKEETYSL